MDLARELDKEIDSSLFSLDKVYLNPAQVDTSINRNRTGTIKMEYSYIQDPLEIKKLSDYAMSYLEKLFNIRKEYAFLWGPTSVRFSKTGTIISVEVEKSILVIKIMF